MIDSERIKTLESLGYKVLVLWEHDIKTNLNTVKEKILEFIK